MGVHACCQKQLRCHPKQPDIIDLATAHFEMKDVLWACLAEHGTLAGEGAAAAPSPASRR